MFETRSIILPNVFGLSGMISGTSDAKGDPNVDDIALYLAKNQSSFKPGSSIEAGVSSSFLRRLLMQLWHSTADHW